MSAKKSIESYEVIKKALDEFLIPTMRFKYKKGNILFRARNNEATLHFANRADIGANSNLDTIVYFGRANEPKQSVFYCSNNFQVVCHEVAPTFNLANLDRKHIVTIGTWELIEDLYLAFLPSNDAIAGLNPGVDALQKNFERIVDLYRDDTTDDTLKLLDYFSREFTKDANGDSFNYLVSCAVANYYYEQLVEDSELKKEIYLDGFLYPSVKLKTDGMNLALTSRTCGLNNPSKLKLIDVIELTLIQVDENTYDVDTIVKCKSINQETGEILW